MRDREVIEKAHKRVKEKKDLYTHIITYVLVSIFLIGLNLFTSPFYMWFVFPIGGWGLAVLGHAIAFYTGGRDYTLPVMNLIFQRINLICAKSKRAKEGGMMKN
jgi:hypothetical protein